MATNRTDNMNSEAKELINQKNIDFANSFIKNSGLDTNQVSDGYHTFGELYEHRIQLWIALCRVIAYWNIELSRIKRYSGEVWRTRHHSDGSLAFGGGWFVLGIGEDSGGQMTYHLPEKYWDECDFAATLEKAPEFDGHSSEDVLERIKLL